MVPLLSKIEVITLLWPGLSNINTAFFDTICGMLEHRRPVVYTLDKISRHVLCLLDHVVPQILPDEWHTILPSLTWLTTSRRGQVVLPRLLVDMRIENEPCSRFLCIPGVLTLRDRPKGEVFISLIPRASVVSGRNEDPAAVPSSQIKSLSQFKSFNCEWGFHVLRDSVQVHLAATSYLHSFREINPYSIFGRCRFLVFIPPCGHPADLVH